MTILNQHPEQKARDLIDRQLIEAGWLIQDKTAFNLHAGLGVAIREWQTDVGEADYVLFVEEQAVGVIEAKKGELAFKLTEVEEQSKGYAEAKLKWVNNSQPLPLVFESTGEITRFTNWKDPKPRSREIFNFPRPETLKILSQEENSLRGRFQDLPPLKPEGLRQCQVTAITNLDESLKKAKDKSLVQMATGAGKTFTAITAVYRWLKPPVKVKRILFLVDTKNLGEQAEQEFMRFVPNDDNRKFTELYTVKRLNSRHVPKDAQVYISTIQRMYSILKGEDLDEGLEEQPLYEQKTLSKQPLPVCYNAEIPPEFFDVVIVDECHRSIYNTWLQVLKYFDSFIVGLTATPDERTFAFFKKNLVSEYPHEQAVADGVNVGNEIFLIETEKSKYGGGFKQGEHVQHRERLTRKKRWERQDEDEAYHSKTLDRSVVAPDQIRTVIRTFKEKLPTLFPHRDEVPKTLVFAKTDSHADDIIQIIREEFNEGNAFCKKITYQAKDDPKTVLSQFRNSFNPRIAVTVDMIATGTDVKPLECLLFMRDVRSRNYFEQMKGRGTRVLNHEELKKVTPSATSAKTHYVIVDAVGVTESIKTASQPLITKPSVSLKDLMMGVVMGGVTDADTVSSLAGRLDRLDRQLEEREKAQIEAVTNGIPLRQIVQGLIKSVDADAIQEEACKREGIPTDQEPSENTVQVVQSERVREVAKPFTGELITLLETIRRDKDQKIDETLDTVLQAGWKGDPKENAQTLVNSFAAYMEEHKDVIDALMIYYQQPYRRKQVTLDMIKTVLDKLRSDRPNLAPVRVWQAYAQLDDVKSNRPENELQAMLSLIRRVSGVDASISSNTERVRRNFQRWIMDTHKGGGSKFTEEQMEWLHMLRDHVITSFRLERVDLDHAPFDAHGGLGKLYQLFGDHYEGLLEELNEALAI
jgi:type I restriction enzyme R subunit